jgi:hypothetical protein
MTRKGNSKEFARLNEGWNARVEDADDRRNLAERIADGITVRKCLSLHEEPGAAVLARLGRG